MLFCGTHERTHFNDQNVSFRIDIDFIGAQSIPYKEQPLPEHKEMSAASCIVLY